ncbi:unnamed protein product [Paramecium sonneborni]|uniref:Armadillo-type fold n=1 Tax=Paramecium sonneborni TaxID=65129 RepID=A0A8S1QUD9_9CILI|nr:unnamed protein product [Paramecium sonneborni]
MSQRRAQIKNQQTVLNPLSKFIKENPNAQITEVLDQDDQWDSKQNGKIFGEYVTQYPERFWEMLKIIYNSEDVDVENIQKKYPFFISEIIGRKEEFIIDYFFYSKGPEQCESLNFLFKTIDRDCIDYTQAGYFCKIVKAIIDKRGFDLWQYLINPQKESKNVLEDFIKHLDVFHIADILFNLIRFDTIRNEGDDVFLNQRISLLLRIIDSMQQKSYNSLIVENVCYILKNLLTETNEIKEKEQFISSILNSKLQFSCFPTSKSSELIDLLIVILEQIWQDHNFVNQQGKYNYYLLQEFSYNLVDLLKIELNLPPFQTSYGTYQIPLGQFKIKLIEFYCKVLKQNNLNIINYFQHQNICFTIMELIQKHYFNNSIQNLFLEIVEQVMQNEDQIEIRQAYIDANICGFLQYLNYYERQQVGQIKKQITIGFQGMVNRLSYLLKNEFKEESWQNYINRLQNIFQNENSYLLGQNPNCIEDEETTTNLISSLISDTNSSYMIDQNLQQNRQQIIQQFGDISNQKQILLEERPINPVTVQNFDESNNSDQPKSIVKFGDIDYFNQLIEDNNNQKIEDNNNQPIVDNNNQKIIDKNNSQIEDNNQKIEVTNNQKIENKNNQIFEITNNKTNIENSKEIQTKLIEDVSKKPFVNPDSPDILVNHWRKKNLRLCRSSNVSGELNDDHIQTRTKSKTQCFKKQNSEYFPKRKQSDHSENYKINLETKPEKRKFEMLAQTQSQELNYQKI